MLNFLRRIVQEVGSAQNLPAALSIVVNRVCEFVHVEACSIYLIDESREHFVLLASRGFKPGVDGHLTVPTGKGLVGLVANKEEPINVEEAQTHPEYSYFKETGEEIYQAFLGVPIIHQRKVLGVLVAQQRDTRKFDEGEEAFLVTISAQLAGMIATAVNQGGLKAIQRQVNHGHQDHEVQGIPGSPGVSIGVGFRTYALADLDSVPDKTIDDIPSEINLFKDALHAAREEVRRLSARLSDKIPVDDMALFDAYLQILDDDSMGIEVIERIETGQWAEGALRDVIRQHRLAFEMMDDPYLRERAEDIKDLGCRVLNYLQAQERETPDYPNQMILMGEEITASNLAEVPREKIVAIVSLTGSSNSHVAILARSMGIPTVMGAQGFPILMADGVEMIVDGYHGKIYIAPSPSLKQEFRRLMKEERELYAELRTLQKERATTLDGHTLPLLVNMGLAADIPSSLDVGAEGVGLYRTEVPFLIRDRFPSEEEQRQIYRQMLEAFAPRPVTMRTLDVGGDKMLPYFQFEEENPFLGWRGLRITLDHPEIFLVQIRAMLRASSGLNNLRIMLPMVSAVTELREAKAFIHQAYEELHELDPRIEVPKIGVMVEVPSAVYQSALLASECDFLSVGSNDLTQYLLAVDRNNPRVANMYDSLHPAVLRALIDVVQGAHTQGKPVSLCGEMAGDPASALLLLAMGYDHLSMNATSLARIKWVIRHFSMQAAQELLAKVLCLDEPKLIRLTLETALEGAGLGGLVRAGK